MGPRRAFRGFLLGAALCAAGARPALAEERACREMAIEVDERLDQRFPELGEEVQRAFAGRRGVERCPSVSLSLEQAAVRVHVRLADGRSAERSVRQREDVVPTLHAMLSVPETSEGAALPAPVSLAREEASLPAKAPAAKRPAARPAKPRARAAVLGGERGEVAARAVSDPRFGIELSVATAARAGDGQYSVGLAILSLLDLQRWLVGLGGRADSFAVPEGAPHAVLELGALLGRRFGSEALTLDVLAGPALALQGQDTVQTGPAGERTETSSGAVPRFHLASHLNFAPRAVVGPFVGVEAEVGDTGGSEGESAASFETLPRWMVGLSVGATVGTR